MKSYVSGALSVIGAMLVLGMLSSEVMASTSGSLGTLGDGIKKITDFMSGPVPFMIAIVAFVGAGAAWMMHVDMKNILVGLGGVLFMIIVLANASSIYTALGGNSMTLSDSDLAGAESQVYVYDPEAQE